MAKSGKVVRLNPETYISWEEALDAFLTWKKAQGVSKTTLEDYQIHVRRFFNRYPKAFKDPKVFKKSAMEYMGQDVKPATYNLRLVYLRAFFKWGVEEGIFQENPLKGLKRRKAEARIVNIEDDILERLLELPDQKTYAGLRDYVLLLLELDTGIRPKEALNLYPPDINLKAFEVYVRSEIAKTRVSRTVPINPITANTIRKLLSSRPREWGDDVPVFCSNEGKRLDRESWRSRLDKYSEQLGVRIRPYDLRHTFALMYLRNGGNAFGLQRTLGHTDLSMTKRYVALTDNDLKNQHEVASPVAKLVPQKTRMRKIKD